MSKCVECGSYYEPRSKLHKLCSDECRASWTDRYQAEYRDRNRERRKAQKRQHYAESHRLVSDETRMCGQCGSEYAPRVHNNRYCSKACANKARPQREQTRTVSRRATRLRPCTVCSSFFPVRRRTDKLCSDPCRAERSRQRGNQWRRRKWAEDEEYRERKLEAGRRWYEENQAHVLAYREETRERAAELWREYKAENAERIRARQREYYQENADDVRSRKREWAKDNREKVAVYERRRRARLAGVESEPYTLSEIYERDGGRCQICGDAVDLSIPWPELLSPSIDHIIPISENGPDTPANVQLAHLTCNSSKKEFTSPGGDQLRLI